MTTHAIRLSRLRGELSYLVRRHPRTPICSEPAPSLVPGHPRGRFTNVRKDVNRRVGLKAPTVCECPAIDRVVADRVHALRHLRLGVSVVTGDGKGPAIDGARGAGAVALASRDDHFARIARVLRHVHADYASQISVEELARKAGMSVAAFHHYFKLVTASSPLQYLKRIRLDQARRLMAHDGYNASTAARAVGYESPSQFSREFKRLFGVTPVEEAEQTRARLVAG